MDNPYINPSNQDGNDNLNNQLDSYYNPANNADNTVSNDQAGYGDGFNKEMFGQPTNIGVTSFTQTTFGQQTNVNQQTSFGQPGSGRNQQYNGPVVQTVDQMYNNMQAQNMNQSYGNQPYGNPAPYGAPYRPYGNPAPYGAPYQPYVEPEDGKATACLILGIVSLVVPYLGWIAAIIALVLGHQARLAGNQSGKVKGGKICAIISLCLYALVIIFVVVMVLFIYQIEGF